MSRTWIRSFAADETGGGTIFGLFWFAVLVGICGLAVDITDGLRTRTMLQSTADSSALAGVIDVPHSDAAIATAVTYAAANMNIDDNGDVLNPSDVVIGRWDQPTKSLDTSAIDPDAVMVTVWRGAANSNAVPVNFLRIIGLQTWNVRAQAIAQRFIPDCFRKDGLIAAETVDLSSNNYFGPETCVHGEEGVNIQSGNFFDPEARVSMIDLADLELPSSGMEGNPGLKDVLLEERLYPKLVEKLDEMMDGYLSPENPESVLPDFINRELPVITVTKVQNFDYNTLEPGRVYHFKCPNSTTNMQINGVEIHDVVIVADCTISFGSGAYVHDAYIASRAASKIDGGSDSVRELAAISAAANVQFGVADNCAPGGGVQLLSNSSMQTSSTTTINGVQMVAKNDIRLGSRDGGVNGISAHAGGNIFLSSNNLFGLCRGGADIPFPIWYYRLVL
jgi:hypothetical protein